MDGRARRNVLGFLMAVIFIIKVSSTSALPYYADSDADPSDPLEAMDKRRGFDSMSGYTFGKRKRNFDEIDRAGFGAFAQRAPFKRNFDEIDRAGFGAFVKRFPGPAKRNFDEIDRAGFGAFVKRNFDEIDRVGFGAFGRNY